MQSGNQQQAADQVSISNSIGSLRMLGADRLARIRREQQRSSSGHCGRILRGVYGRMDFATRDQLPARRRTPGQDRLLSRRRSGRQGAQLARESAARSSGDDPAAHVGFHLIDKGLPNLERIAQVRLPPLKKTSGGPAASIRFLLSGHDRTAYRKPGRRVAPQGVWRWRARMAAGRGGHSCADRIESDRRRAGQLDGADDGEAASVAA